MISETDIVAGYMWILGRMPTTAEIDGYRAHDRSSGEDGVRDFQMRLLISEEFRNRRLFMDRHRRASRSSLDRRRLAFVHIEKCGGTTLHDMLASQFPPAAICPERYETIGDWTINELSDYALFTGHFNLAWCRCIPGEVSVITMLREPRARLVSLFSFWKAHRPDPDRDLFDLLRIARDSTAEEFFANERVREHPSVRDAIAGQLTRTRLVHALEPDDPILTDPDRVLAVAASTLEGLAAFGLVEAYEDSRLLLNAALGLRMQPVPPRQVLDAMVRDCPDLVPVPPVAMTPRLDRLLDGLTRIDGRLYARARTLFDARLAAMRRPEEGRPGPRPGPAKGRGPLEPGSWRGFRRVRR